MLNVITRTKSEFSTMLLRLGLGALMWPHGAQKLGWYGGMGIEKTIEHFEGMGIPAWQGYLVIAAESLGAIALVLGVGTRIAALGILGVMVGAIHHVHLKNGFFASDGGYEFQAFIALVAFVVFLKGGGALSIDRRLSGRGPAD